MCELGKVSQILRKLIWQSFKVDHRKTKSKNVLISTDSKNFYTTLDNVIKNQKYIFVSRTVVAFSFLGNIKENVKHHLTVISKNGKGSI